ncbi:eCIS core domain-containing protein, partial [Ruminiclostridium cellobioparum]|uniref:eCIS core domain-containing protein n=1 Tax=Ruminiclostridium cellobioparum TaxID=29355 RepID=UPI000E3E0C00
MQTKMLVKKTEPASGRTNNPVNNNHKNKPAANKKNVRTTDYKKLLQMMLNDPDAITREEFLFLQSIIGYRQAVVAREKAKQRKQQRKIEQTNLVMKQILLERSNSEIKKDSDGKKETSELKNNDEKNPLQMKKGDGNTTLSGSSIQHNLRAGLEKISGVDLSDVKVHQNSDKPQQVGALAYTQGNDIYIAPGQEKHLPHEGWHAVQQKQGVVKPTLQMKSGTLVNDDAGLEKEADDMGRIATEEGRSLLNTQQLSSKVTQPQLSEGKIIQRVETKGQTYIVKKGDTLGGIAIKYNVS